MNAFWSREFSPVLLVDFEFKVLYSKIFEVKSLRYE